MEKIIELQNICKSFLIGDNEKLEVLKNINLTVCKGEFIAIVGASGSGKSTLMNIIGALDRPTSGKYYLASEDISDMKDKALSEIRNRKIGFVFQNFNLIARTDAVRNVALPMLYAGVPGVQADERAKSLLRQVDMADRMYHNPSELSGGQKQRVAIARSMANNPDIILADEPTGALDSVTGRLIMDLFHRLHQDRGKTIVLITHSPELARECERIIIIKDGCIVKEERGNSCAAG